MKQRIFLLLCFFVVIHAQHINAQNTFPSSGNVGIGTTSPQAPLHVNGTIYAGNTSSISGSVILSGIYHGAGDYLNAIGGMYSTGATMISYALKPANNYSDLFLSSTAISIGRAALTVDGQAFRFYSAPTQTVTPGNAVAVTEVFTINGNGTIKIGNLSYLPSGYKLFVEQGILTEKVKVAIKTTGDWSDHVFHKDYPLMSLSQVEQFIKTNGHLPNIPSAEDVAKNGIDLGKMDAKLLEKIEELTLYTIELKKEVTALQDEVKALKKK